jgi:hypothetical protein
MWRTDVEDRRVECGFGVCYPQLRIKKPEQKVAISPAGDLGRPRKLHVEDPAIVAMGLCTIHFQMSRGRAADERLTAD